MKQKTQTFFLFSFTHYKFSVLFWLIISFSSVLQAQTTVNFNYTGAVQTWTVPSCVTSINVNVKGGQGGGSLGGLGAGVTATFTVTPGQVLQINVGGQGGFPGGGFNGGGLGWAGTSNSGGGGGASDIRITPYALTNRIIVAAGGGGAGGGGPTVGVGGVGGCVTGVTGTGSPFQTIGGTGGAQASGGIGGPPWSGGGLWGINGSLALGGNGGHDPSYGASGGGGGGGFYGGGGGGSDGCCTGSNGGAGGGGGSCYTPIGGVCTQGIQSGNGLITITYMPSAPVAGTVSALPTTICSGQTSALTLTGSFGTIQWQISTNGGTTWTNIIGATIATYTTTVLSSNTCYRAALTACGTSVYSSMVCITVNPLPVITAPANISVCSGTSIPASNFISTPTGATYTWTNSNTSIGLGASGTGQVPGFTGTNSSSSSISGTITVTPTIGSCTGTAISYTITINPLPVITAPANIIECAGTLIPASTFVSTPTGATYTWTNSNTSIGLAASGTGQVPGFTGSNTTSSPITATITVIPSMGSCTGSAITYTVTIKPLPVITAPANISVCSGTAISASNFISTPAGATYTWTNSNTSIGLGASGTGQVPGFTGTNSSSSSISGTITVTPTIGTCTGSAISYTITINPLPVITAPANVTECAGTLIPASTFVSTPTGATYNWTNSNTSIGLGASGTGQVPGFTGSNTTSSPITGTITVTPTISGCTGNSISYSITINPKPIINATATLDSICYGFSSSLNVTCSVIGAVFTWMPGNLSGAQVTVNPTISTIYTVVGLVAGCSGMSVVNVTVNENPTATATSSDEHCGHADGITDANPSGGLAPYTFNWNGSILPNPLIGLTANTYSVTVTDDNGCTATSSTILNNIAGPSAPFGTIAQETCTACNGSIVVMPVNGTQPYNYSWSNQGTNSSISGLCQGPYGVTVTDANNCTATNQTTITDSPPPNAVTSMTNATCDQPTGSASVIITGGSGSYTLLWSNGSTSSSISGLVPNNYCVTIDDGSCIITSCVDVLNNPGPTANFSVSPSLMTIEEPVCVMTDQSIGATTWSWSFGDGSGGSGIQNPSHTYANIGQFEITLLVTDANGCKDSTTRPVVVKAIYTIYIPNAFTPNGDGVNDFFSPTGLNIDLNKFEMIIFDRWGSQIFFSQDINKPWNGTINNSGDLNSVIMDSYVYKILTRDLVDGATHEYYGRVSIVQ